MTKDPPGVFSPAPTERRRNAALGYAVAASLVLVAAAVLRFDGLGESSLGMDEARAAVWAQGSLAEVVEYTRYNTSPILYPIALHLVQKIETSPFAVRFLPALASTLTVAALLFLLPSAGVSRRAAFLSGTLAAVSVAAITEAHGVREYSLDALLAALLIVGLLRYARDGRRLLLGTCLGLAPFVQYGLVLFGAAVLATAFFLPAPPAPARPEPPEPPEPEHRGFGARLRARKGLLGPAALSFVGGAVSWWTTLRPQLAWQVPRLESGRGLVLDHLQQAYYSGNPADLPALLRWLSAALGDLLRDQLAAPLPAVSLSLLGAGSLLLGFRVARRKWPRRSPAAESDRSPGPDFPEPVSPLRVVLLLFAVSLAFAAAAATAGLYPLGAGRHGTYLGPVLFTAAGLLLATATELPKTAFRRPLPPFLSPLLFAAVLGGVVHYGAAAIAERTDFPGIGTGQRIAALLAEETRPDDLVYVFGDALSVADFHLPPRLGNRIVRHDLSCVRNLSCTEYLARMARDRPEPPGRLWIVAGRRGGPWLRESLRAWNPEVRLQTVVRADGVSWDQHGSDIRLYRIEGPPAALAARFPPVAPGEPEPPDWGVRWETPDWGAPTLRSTVRSAFEVWRREDAIVYRRSPCSPEDTEARFILELHPASGAGPDAPETPALDFFFAERGIREDRECVAIAPLPEGEYSRFVTGQWSETTNWRVAGRLDEDRYRAAMREAASGAWGPPLERAAFDLHLEGNELRYFRNRCSAPDTEARFFLHLHYLHSGDASADPGNPRHENRDFDFPEYGVAADGECLAMVPLPADGSFHRLSTGQWRPGESPFWRADLWFPSRPAALESITSGVWGPPAARSAFDLHLAPDGLWYHRADCSAEDRESRFFLHLYPADPADLPPERRDHGFENRDFAFSDYGSPLADACLARVPLPDYPLARLRTGQFEPGRDPLWTATLDLPAPPPVE